MTAAQLLLSRGADVNARDDVGRTAFSYACEMHCNDIVQLLIRNNVDPDVPDNNGEGSVLELHADRNYTNLHLSPRICDFYPRPSSSSFSSIPTHPRRTSIPYPPVTPKISFRPHLFAQNCLFINKNFQQPTLMYQFALSL